MSSKMIYLIITILAFNLGVFLFSCSNWNTDGTCATGFSDENNTIWDFAKNPQTFSGDVTTNSIWKTIFGLEGLLAVGAGIFITASIVTGSEVFLFIGIGMALLPQMGIFLKLYYQIVGSAYFSGRHILGWVTAIMVMMPIILCWIFIVIEWIRGRD